MTLATYLTLFRILLVPVLINAIAYYEKGDELLRYIAIAIFVVACFTDAIDGYVARVFKQKTTLGTLLDPLADKLLLVSAFLSITFQTNFTLRPPIWIVVVLTSRDVLIIMGLLIIFFTTGKIQVSPNLIGKMTTFFQMITVLFLLLQNSIVPVFWYLTAILTILSGAVYLVREGRRLREISVS